MHAKKHVKCENNDIRNKECDLLEEKEKSNSNNQAQLRKSRRQAGEIIWDDEHFPPCSKFQPPTKLPTISSVIGRVRYLTMG